MGKDRLSMTVRRPDQLVEARIGLSPKQCDILDFILHSIEKDNNLYYEINLSDYIPLYDCDTSNIYRDFKKAAKDFKTNQAAFTLYNYMGKEEIDIFFFALIWYEEKKGRICFELAPQVKEILLQMKSYTKYDLKYPINLGSKYSKRLYYQLKKYQDTGFRIDKLENLIAKLECPSSYKKYSLFKNKVLDIAKKEIDEKTDIYFDFEPQMQGNRVKNIKFYIHKKPEIEPESSIVETAATVDGANKILLKEIRNIITDKISDQDCLSIYNAAAGNLDIIKEKYNLAKSQRKVHNLTGFLISSIKNDYKVVARESSKDNKFNNFHQREYDYELLEKQLLNRD